MTPLFRIFVPFVVGRNARLNETRVDQFEQALMDSVGAFTREPPVSGFWTDEKGQRVRDLSSPYLIGAPPGIMADVTDAAHRIWPEEKAIFVMQVGSFAYSYRNDLPKGDDAFEPSLSPADEAPPRDRCCDMRDGWYSRDGTETDGRPVIVPTAYDAPGDVVGPYSPVVVLPREVPAAIRRVMAMETVPALYPHAMTTAERLRAEGGRYDAAAWAIDSALSKWRKSDPASGYRNNPALGDAPWDRPAIAEELAQAVKAGAALLA